MNVEALTNLIVSFLVLAFLYYLVFGVYQRYRVDRFRHDLFVLRDDLFDRAADGYISFDHSAYILMRTLMNGYIRYAHQLSLFQPLFVLAMERVRGPLPDLRSFNTLYNDSTAGLTLEQKSIMDDYNSRVNALVIKHVTRAMPEMLVFIPLALVIGAVILVRQALNHTRRSLNLEKAVERRAADMAFEFGKQ